MRICFLIETSGNDFSINWFVKIFISDIENRLGYYPTFPEISISSSIAGIGNVTMVSECFIFCFKRFFIAVFFFILGYLCK